MARSDKKGNPSGEGKSKGNIKEEDAKRVLDLEREEVYRERYTDEEGENADKVSTSNPNRNVNKGRKD
jgi:hypothetical protein